MSPIFLVPPGPLFPYAATEDAFSQIMGSNRGEEGTPVCQRQDESSAYWNFIAACDFVASQIVHDTLNSLSTPDLELRTILASQNTGSADLDTCSADLRSSLQSALEGIQGAQAILGRFRASTRLHHTPPQLVDFRKCANDAITSVASVLSVSVSPLDLQQSMPVWVEIDKVAFQSLCFLWMRLVRLTYLDAIRLSMELRKVDLHQDGCELCLSTDVPLSRIRVEWLTAPPMSEEPSTRIEPPYQQFAIYMASILHRIQATLKVDATPENMLKLSIIFVGATEREPSLGGNRTILSSPSRKYVLVVESNEYVRNSLVALLQAMGYGAIEATSAIEARQITDSFPFPFAGKIIDEQTTGLSLQACSIEWPDWFQDGVVLWTSPRVETPDRWIASDDRNLPDSVVTLPDSVVEVHKPYSLEHLLRYFVSQP